MRSIFLEKAIQNEPEIKESVIRGSCFGRPVPDENQWFQYQFKETDVPQYMEKGKSYYIDFGNHYTGYLSFTMKIFERYPDAPVKVHVKFAENIYELVTDYATYNQGMCSAWLQEEVLCIEAPMEVALARRYAFRYIKVTIEATPFPIILDDFCVKAVSSADITKCKPISCEESLLEIDRIGCRTLQNCMQRIFEDGPKRDRRLWVGDLRLQALAGYYTFQNIKVVKKCLYLFAGYTESGHRVPRDIHEHSKGTYCEKKWLFDYSLMFSVSLCDYYEHTRDTELIDELFEVADEQVYIAMQDIEEGVVKELGGWWAFVDWCEGLNKVTSVQGILLYTIDKMIRLCEETSRKEKVVKYNQYAETLRQAAKEKLYDEKSGLFVNAYDDFQLSLHSQVWMILGNVLDKKEAKALMQKILQNKEAKGAVTPYMHHYVVEALIHADMKEEALAYIKEYWGGMVRNGADTYWEVFIPKNFMASPYGDPIMNSSCHAWSCTASYFIRRYYCYMPDIAITHTEEDIRKE